MAGGGVRAASEWGLEVEEDFSTACGGAGVEEGFVEVSERVDGGDRLVDGAVEDEVGEGGVEGTDLGGGEVGEPAGEPEAVEVEVFEDEKAVGDLEGLAAHGTVGGHGATGGEEVEETEGAVAADGVDGEGGRGEAGDFGGGGWGVGVVGEDGVGTGGEASGGGFGAADEVERVEAEVAGEADDAVGGGGAGGVLNDP
jgi:hypothetical protein